MIHSSRNSAILRKKTINGQKQSAESSFQQHAYPHRLNFYGVPPTAAITLEQFEQWAIDRLRVLAELDACSFRYKTLVETAKHISPLLQKCLPLHSNTSSSLGWRDEKLKLERQKDHYSHFILRLAFSSTDEQRQRFTRIESTLFKIRLQDDDARERQDFIDSLDVKWEVVSEEEKRQAGIQIMSASLGLRKQEADEGAWFKMDWETVPELVESRKVLVKKGKAYVPAREQTSMIHAEFNALLLVNLIATSRALPRLDEDDRLSPILDHISKNLSIPSSSLADTDTSLSGANINAASIDAISEHFPLCMHNLHMNLRQNSHLKHFGRLQFTLFLKGLGLSMDECLIFWRRSFKLVTDETFNKEYRYNVRHTYGDVGGDANRRGRGYSPFSCQKILTEHPPGSGENHGCPYRHFSVENLVNLLQTTGVNNRDVLRGVREDVEKKRYHIACNRVFEWAHQDDLKRVKREGTWAEADLDVIVHPNTYFKRSFMLKTNAKP